jgi:hypothetical protein
MFKAITIVLTGILLCAGLSFAETVPPNVEVCTPELLAGRGCCSHHSGVCGCSGGSVKCCDGSFSPSCGCLKEDVLEDLKNRQEHQGIEGKLNQ